MDRERGKRRWLWRAEGSCPLRWFLNLLLHHLRMSAALAGCPFLSPRSPFLRSSDKIAVAAALMRTVMVMGKSPWLRPDRCLRAADEAVEQKEQEEEEAWGGEGEGRSFEYLKHKCYNIKCETNTHFQMSLMLNVIFMGLPDELVSWIL